MSTLFGADEPRTLIVTFYGGPRDGATETVVTGPHGELPPELYVGVPVTETLLDPVEPDAPREHVGVYRCDRWFVYRWAGYR